MLFSTNGDLSFQDFQIDSAEEQGTQRRLYGCKCSGCKNLISPNELVMKALQNVYHVDCFKCDECGDKLEKGDEFILKEDRLYCSADFNVAEQKSDIDVFSSDEIDSMSTTSPKSPKFDEKGLDVSSGCKRPRTILTSQQRADFKAAFELTPKPCRKVREQLSHDTGLSVRVVQVWFQNQRAKLKKIQKKAEEGGGTEKIKKANGPGKVTKKKRPKSTSSTKSSESSTSSSEFNLPASTAMTSQFTSVLDMSSSYTSPNMSNYYANMATRQDILNNNQPNMLNQQTVDFNLRTSFPYNRNSFMDAMNSVNGLQPSYCSNFQLTSAVNNELTTAPPTTSHFQLMPHLMNSF